MYKLTIIAGPNRGTTYAVQEGELTIGRQTGNTIVLPSSKVSKRHCLLVAKGAEIVVKDQGSSNGTFVNGVLAKVKAVRPGDRISVGEYVLELSEPPVRRVQVAPAVSGLGNIAHFPQVSHSAVPVSGGAMGIHGVPGGQSSSSVNHPPKDLKGKVVWFFENRLMPIFYVFNLKYEWNIICVGMFFVFVVGNLVVSVYPLLEANRKTIVKETGARAKFMARQIAEQNSGFLASRNETKTEIGMIDSAEGVRLAVLIDLDNRIIAPASKMNQYLAAGNEALVAVAARDRFRAGGESGFWIESGQDTVVAIEPVKVVSPTAGKNVVVAMAVVSIDTSLATPDIGELGTIYSETLIMTGLIGGLILLILYRLTLKPFQVLNEDLDKALKGDLSQVTHEFKIQELNPLWDIINSAIQRIPKGANPGGSANPLENTTSIEEFVGPFKTLGEMVNVGLVVFDSDKRIAHMNSAFEEISGIRLDSAMGQEISSVARDQAMGSFTNDILSRAPVGGEGVSEDFDFSGTSYKMSATAFGSAGGTAKCYVLAALRAAESG